MMIGSLMDLGVKASLLSLSSDSSETNVPK